MIIIQGPWPSLNDYINAERSNRFIAAKMKKEETERIQWQCKGTTPISGKVDITFKAFVKNRKKDPDGIYLCFVKFCLDAFVELKILQNDTQQFIGRITLEPVEIDVNERMEITIT